MKTLTSGTAEIAPVWRAQRAQLLLSKFRIEDAEPVVPLPTRRFEGVVSLRKKPHRTVRKKYIGQPVSTLSDELEIWGERASRSPLINRCEWNQAVSQPLQSG